MEEEFIAAFGLVSAEPTETNQRKCYRAAIRFITASWRGMQRSRICPALAAIVAYGETWDCGIILNAYFGLVRLLVMYYRQFRFRGRAMWNDYEMARWLFTHDAKYIPLIYRQIHRLSKDDRVRLTGHWMVRSIIDEHADFAGQWRARYANCPTACTVEIQETVARLPEEVRQRAETIL